jgi:hypothetical protein
VSTTSVSNNLASSLTTLIQEIQSQAPTNTGSSNLLSALESSLGTQQSDNSELSPLAEVLTTLQQLQQSNPTESDCHV